MEISNNLQYCSKVDLKVAQCLENLIHSCLDLFEVRLLFPTFEKLRTFVRGFSNICEEDEKFILRNGMTKGVLSPRPFDSSSLTRLGQDLRLKRRKH